VFFAYLFFAPAKKPDTAKRALLLTQWHYYACIFQALPIYIRLTLVHDIMRAVFPIIASLALVGLFERALWLKTILYIISAGPCIFSKVIYSCLLIYLIFITYMYVHYGCSLRRSSFFLVRSVCWCWALGLLSGLLVG